MAHYREKAIRAGPASAASRRNAAPIAPKLKMIGRRSCARLRGTALRRGERPRREAPRTGSSRRVASIPTAALRRARTGWRYAPPLDTTSRVRVRARRGAKNALNGEAKRLRGFEIDHQLEIGRLLDRQVRRIR